MKENRTILGQLHYNSISWQKHEIEFEKEVICDLRYYSRKSGQMFVIQDRKAYVPSALINIILPFK